MINFETTKVIVVDGVEILTNTTDYGAVFVFVLCALLGIFIYFMPFCIAIIRKSTDKLAAFLVNFLFGWSILGWCVALIMAIKNNDKK